MKKQGKKYVVVGMLGLLCLFLMISPAQSDRKSLVKRLITLFSGLNTRFSAMTEKINRLEKKIAELERKNQIFSEFQKLFSKKELKKRREEKEARERPAGERREHSVHGVKFAVRWIPAGSFMMGRAPNELVNEYVHKKNETPQRQVSFTRGFWMMENEVTQKQWRALMRSNPSHFNRCGDNCPVEWVSWYDARAFADKLSVAQGLTACTATDNRIFQCEEWRLPTEAEWEYAARAGTTDSRYGKIDDIAWYDKNSKKKTHPVGGKRANAWGLRDMLGNVWEWTMDADGPYMRLSQKDPLRSNGGSDWICRGGGWRHGRLQARSAYRGTCPKTWKGNDTGFRLIRY